MSLIQEFKEYSNIMLAREKHETLSNISFKFSLLITNILMNLGYNKNLVKSDKNKFLNIGSGNIHFDGLSNTDLFPSLGQGPLAQFDANEREFESLYITARK